MDGGDSFQPCFAHSLRNLLSYLHSFFQCRGVFIPIYYVVAIASLLSVRLWILFNTIVIPPHRSLYIYLCFRIFSFSVYICSEMLILKIGGNCPPPPPLKSQTIVYDFGDRCKKNKKPTRHKQHFETEYSEK